jgi:hypothetical protein
MFNEIKELNNGARPITFRGDKVLANWSGEYVVWTHDDNGNTFWGHYFKDDRLAAWRYFEKVTADYID